MVTASTTICAFYIYLSDNIMWMEDMGFIEKEFLFNSIRWRMLKDIFALLKNVLGILKLILEQIHNYRKQHYIFKRMKTYQEEKFRDNFKVAEDLDELLTLRSK